MAGIKQSLILCGCINFIGAVEYSVVMPSLWTYLHSFGAGETFYGATLASFSATKILATPLFGYWSDHAPMSHVLLASLLFGITGNMVYATAHNQYWVLAGRMVAGFGAANGPVVLAYVSRVTTDAARTRAVALISGVGLIALACGPALNIGLSHANFYMGPLHVTETTSVGYTMAALLVILFMSVFILFRNPAQVAPSSSADEKPPLRDMLAMSFALPLVTSYVTLFTIGFAQSAFETILTPVLKSEFGWNIVDNSYVFAGMAGIVASMTVVVALLASKVEDRRLVITGSVLTLIAISFCIWLWQGQLTPVRFLVPLGFSLIGNPMLGMPNRSLFSKMTDPRYQGFYQSGMSLVRSFANIFGPLWGGLALKHWGLVVTFYGVTGLFVVHFILYVFSYKRMLPSGETVESMNTKTRLRNQARGGSGRGRVDIVVTASGQVKGGANAQTPLLQSQEGQGNAIN